MVPFVTKRTLLLGIFVTFLLTGIAYAINTTIDGWRFSPSQTLDVILADWSCRRVTNNNTSPYDRFLPTRSMNEWASFETNTPAWVTIANCNTWRNYAGQYGVYWRYNGPTSKLDQFSYIACSQPSCYTNIGPTYMQQHFSNAPTYMLNATPGVAMTMSNGNDADGDHTLFYISSTFYYKWYADKLKTSILWLNQELPTCSQPPPVVNGIAFKQENGVGIGGQWTALWKYYKCVPGDRWEYCTREWYSYNVYGPFEVCNYKINPSSTCDGICAGSSNYYGQLSIAFKVEDTWTSYKFYTKCTTAANTLNTTCTGKMYLNNTLGGTATVSPQYCGGSTPCTQANAQWSNPVIISKPSGLKRIYFQWSDSSGYTSVNNVSASVARGNESIGISYSNSSVSNVYACANNAFIGWYNCTLSPSVSSFLTPTIILQN